jgi:hypothetical protein
MYTRLSAEGVETDGKNPPMMLPRGQQVHSDKPNSVLDLVTALAVSTLY